MDSQIKDIAAQILQKSVELSKLGAQLVELQEAAGAATALPADTSLSQWLARIYEDKLLTNIEFQQLRDEADSKVDALKVVYPQVDELAAFQQAADDTVQYMQKGILSFKKQKIGKPGIAIVNEAFAFQVAYIKACLDRFTQSA